MNMRSLRSFLAFCLISFAAFAAEELLPSYTLTSYVSNLGAVIYSADIPGDPEAAALICFHGGLSAEENLMGSGEAALTAAWLRKAIDRARFAGDCPWQDVDCRVSYTRDSLEISFAGLRDKLKLALQSVFGILSEPALSEEEFSDLREKLSAFAAEKEKDEKSALQDLWRRTAFDTMLEAVPLQGYSAQIAKLTLPEFLAYQKRVFVSGNVSLSLAGSLYGFGMDDCVKECLAKLPEGVFLKDDRVAVNEEKGANIAIRTSEGQDSLICAGYVLRAGGEQGSAPALTFARLLKKQLPELEKRLAEEFRQRIPVEFRQEEELNGISLRLLCQVFPVDCPKARIIMSRWLKEAAGKKYSNEEVRAEADRLLSELSLECGTSRGVARGLSLSALRKSGPFGLQERAKKLNDLTAEKLRAYCASNLRSGDLVMVWSDPVEKLEPRAAEFLRLEREILENIGYQHDRTVLPGKAELIVQKREDETMVRCAFIALGGNWYEETFNNGVFAVLAEFLASGSYDRPGFQKTLRECGAVIRPLDEPQVIGFEATVPARHFARVLPCLCQAWTKPKLTEENVAEAVRGTLARLAAQNTNYAESAEMLIRQTLFKEHPYALDRYGNPFVIERIKAKDAAEFYKEYITPDNTAIVISGPVNEKEAALTVLRECKEFFGKERALAQNERADSKPRIKAEVPSFGELRPEREKRFTAPEQEAMAVLGSALPGGEEDEALPCLFSWSMEKAFRRCLFKLKEKYGENAVGRNGFAFYPGYGAGYWYAWFRIKPKLAEEALEEAAKVFEETQAELGDPEGFAKLKASASQAAALYARRSPDFMKRAYRRTLYSTNDWPDIIRAAENLGFESASNYVKRVQAPSKVLVMPETEGL